MHTLARLSAIGFVLSTLAACQSLDSYVTLKLAAAPQRADGTLEPLGTRPTSFTHEALAANGLRWRASDCNAILSQLATAPSPDAQRAFAIAEVHLLAAQAPACRRDRTRSLIESARGAYQLLGAATGDHAPPTPLVIALYNRAVATLLTQPDWLRAARASNSAQDSAAFPLEITPAVRAQLAQYDRLLDSERITVAGLLEHHRRAGLGAALIATQSMEHIHGIAANYFRRGAALPITAILHFDTTRPRLELFPGDEHSSVQINATEWPLHADFTAPYAWTQHGSKWRRAGLLSAFFPRRLAPARGVYLLEPPSAEKIPILMIHGLAAGPQAWRNITNELLGTEDVRRHYQVWHYFYPTGQPYLQSAAELRSDLAALRASVQQRLGRSLPPIVVIGHSQGGLLARALVTAPGATLWNVVFTVPPERLSVTEADRDAFRAALLYEPTPAVARIVFMETPHLGSAVSDRSAILRLLDLFVDVPDELANKLRHLARTHAEELTPFARRIALAGGPSPLNSLAASSPLTQAFGRLPLEPPTRYHSIIAARDEYLTYESAHLAGVESELVLPARHQETDGAASLAEIVRILRRHRLESP